MTYKQIEASREARLWLSQVIVPAIAGAAFIFSNPEAKAYISEQATKLKLKGRAVVTKFRK